MLVIWAASVSRIVVTTEQVGEGSVGKWLNGNEDYESPFISSTYFCVASWDISSHQFAGFFCLHLI